MDELLKELRSAAATLRKPLFPRGEALSTDLAAAELLERAADALMRRHSHHTETSQRGSAAAWSPFDAYRNGWLEGVAGTPMHLGASFEFFTGYEDARKHLATAPLAPTHQRRPCPSLVDGGEEAVAMAIEDGFLPAAGQPPTPSEIPHPISSRRDAMDVARAVLGQLQIIDAAIDEAVARIQKSLQAGGKEVSR